MQKVHDEMKSLSPEQRRCLEMKMEGYSYEETAEHTGLSISAVKSLWNLFVAFVFCNESPGKYLEILEVRS